MKSVQFYTQKTQSTFLLVYISISIIFFSIFLSSLPYIIFEPETDAAKLSFVFIGIIVFVFITLFLIGLFVYDSAKKIIIDSEEAHQAPGSVNR